MATVITNLLSAIPFFGHDLVESKYNFATELIFCLGQTGIGFKNTILPVLPTVGTVSMQALKKGRKLRKLRK